MSLSYDWFFPGIWVINVDCISSNVLPFVSGTNFHTNKIVKAHIPVKMKNVPARNTQHRILMTKIEQFVCGCGGERRKGMTHQLNSTPA